MVERRPIIGVMGSAQSAPPWAEALGAAIAREGWNLLTGGGAGVMAAVSRGFVESGVTPRGVTIGILPEVSDRYPNPWVEIPIVTPLGRYEPGKPLSRNDLNVLTASVVLALPGGVGTRNECELACKYGKKLVYLGPEGAFEDCPEAPREDSVEGAIQRLNALLDGAPVCND